MAARFTPATDISISLTLLPGDPIPLTGITRCLEGIPTGISNGFGLPSHYDTASSGTNNHVQDLFKVTWCLEPAAGVSTSRNDHWQRGTTPGLQNTPRYVHASRDY